MKRTFIDKLVGLFSPESEVRRLQYRAKAELITRSYDAAKTFSTDDWTSATKGSANLETRGAQETLKNKARDAIRNNPYANRGLSAIVSNVVGAGIVPNIKGKNKLQTKRLNDAWKEWGLTTLCDANGKHNFYGLQAQVMKSVPSDGEIISMREINPAGMQLRLLESDYIVSWRDSGGVNLNDTDTIIQGVKVDKTGRVKSYFLYESHPGEIVTHLGEREVPVGNLDHVYRQDRPGQLRGVSWFHPVLRQLEDFNEFQQATLISRKISACFSAFITTNNEDATLSSSDLIAKREAESMLSPGNIRYLSHGEGIVLASPPKVDGYEEYCNQVLRAIASGLGITFEALTSNYANVNFSSGRMGHLEFRRNVEMWRWGMLIPQFCDPSFQHFLKWCTIVKGIDTAGASVEWVPPSWSMIDPDKEIAAFRNSIRSGLTSYKKAVREQGYDPEELMQEIADSNAELDALGIVLDSDPRKITQAGLLQVEPQQNNSNQSGDNSSVQQNKEVPASGTPQKSN